MTFILLSAKHSDEPECHRCFALLADVDLGSCSFANYPTKTAFPHLVVNTVRANHNSPLHCVHSWDWFWCEHYSGEWNGVTVGMG